MLPRCLLFPAALALAALPVAAQPSGGPYGPSAQRYELPQAQHIYFVAPDGNAGAPGTALDRPTTLDAVIARVVTGDAIILRGGTYRTGNLVLNQGVTIQPYADEQPVVKGTVVATEWEALPGGQWRTHWTRLFPAAPADWWRRSERSLERTPLHLFNNDMVFFDGRLLGAVGRGEDVTADTYLVDYENGTVTIGADPANHVVEITAHDGALLRTMRDVHGRKNDRRGPTIRGITFTQYARLALEVEGVEPGRPMREEEFGKEVVGTTLENLTISFCSRVAGYFRGDRFTMRHCLVSDCGSEGIYVINSADILLERNIVTRTNESEHLGGYFASAVKIFNQTHRATCRDNLIIDNPGATGVWYDVGNVDGVFVNNWVQNCETGFFFEISHAAICAGNVFVDCRTGTRILNSDDVQVYQNTFFNSPAQFSRNQRDSAAGDHFGWHASSGPGVEERDGHAFVNNLLVADETHSGALLQTSQSPQVRDRCRNPQLAALDGNVYVRPVAGTKPPVLLTWNPAPDTERGYLELTSLDELRARHPEFAAHSRVFTGNGADVFRSPELGHFELQESFSGANTGVPVPEKIRDALHWKADAAVFPGAYAPRP